MSGESTALLQAYYSTRKFAGSPELFQTTIYLPSNSGILEPVTSGFLNNGKTSKNDAALAALRRLLELGKLDGWLQPSWGSSRRGRQLEAEPTPAFSYSFTLEGPLAPRTVYFTRPGRKITLHISGTSRSGINGGSSSSLEFGVLLWEQLPADQQLAWPAWQHQDQQQPHTVSPAYQGSVQLTAGQLLQLLHYQQALHSLLNWSSKRLLGMRGQITGDGSAAVAAAAAAAAEPEQARLDQARPLNPQQFQQRAGFWLAADAAADNLPAALAAALGSILSSSSAAAEAEAARLLAGAEEAYDLEGLEFLGDVVLKFLATNYTLQVNPADANEGELSVQKATLVRNVELARKAHGRGSQLQLDRHMLLLPFSSVVHCADAYTPTGAYPGSSSSSSSSSSWAIGLQRPQSCERQEKGKRLADGVEALIGAVYLTAAAAAAAPNGVVGSTGSAAVQGVMAGSSGSSMPVSERGLAAAAAFCEAIGVLPPGSAATAATPPLHALLPPAPQHQQQQQQQQQQLQQSLGHSFDHPSLLAQALRHVSVFGCQSYQRLEFLGDALLDLAVSGWLMQQTAATLAAAGGSSAAAYAPAELSWRRAALVNNTHLGRAAAAAGLQQHLQARSSQLDRAVRRFAEAQAAAAAGIEADAAAAADRQAESEEQREQALQQLLQEVAPGVHWSSDCRRICQDVWAAPRKTTAAADAASASGNGVSANASRSSTQQTDQAAAGPEAAAAAAAAAGDDKAPRRKPLRAPKVVADLVESTIGAVYVDSMAGGVGRGEHAWQEVWGAVQRLLQLPGNQHHGGGS
ncbi:hypothetical protein OEZ85_003223 [Tetradesmus obliquus]|uniref:RNase III domain-containing protein n=1 Tax=Tetradesmus obliquus TaxID=3088 RepID=A0ABY8TZY2_TETOB|nr:hypothetical protein OEZ85_003223 [Tetradesmus obliquus]